MKTLTIVQKIHKEIDTADDRLYNQAMAIIESGKSFDFEKANRLKICSTNKRRMIVHPFFQWS